MPVVGYAISGGEEKGGEIREDEEKEEGVCRCCC
jgi:hypothetical protein